MDVAHRDNYPIDEAGEYLADLEALSDELEKVADWVVIDWQGGNASASTLEHDWGMVVDMCLDAYIHVNPESNEDMKRLPSYLNKHVEWLTAIKRDLSRAVAPGSLGVPRVRAPDCESV